MFVYMAYISQKIDEIIIGITVYLSNRRIAVHYNNDSQQSLYSLNMMLQ